MVSVTQYVAEVQIIAAGSPEDFGEEEIATMAEAFAADAGVQADAVEVSISAASVLIKVIITMPSALEATAWVDQATSADGVLANASAVSAFLAEANVVAEADPTAVSTSRVVLVSPDDEDEDESSEEDVASAEELLAIGLSLFFFIVALLLCIYVKETRKARSVDVSPAPPPTRAPSQLPPPPYQYPPLQGPPLGRNTSHHLPALYPPPTQPSPYSEYVAQPWHPIEMMRPVQRVPSVPSC